MSSSSEDAKPTLPAETASSADTKPAEPEVELPVENNEAIAKKVSREALPPENHESITRQTHSWVNKTSAEINNKLTSIFASDKDPEDEEDAQMQWVMALLAWALENNIKLTSMLINSPSTIKMVGMDAKASLQKKLDPRAKMLEQKDKLKEMAQLLVKTKPQLVSQLKGLLSPNKSVAANDTVSAGKPEEAEQKNEKLAKTNEPENPEKKVELASDNNKKLEENIKSEQDLKEVVEASVKEVLEKAPKHAEQETQKVEKQAEEQTADKANEQVEQNSDQAKQNTEQAEQNIEQTKQNTEQVEQNTEQTKQSTEQVEQTTDQSEQNTEQVEQITEQTEQNTEQVEQSTEQTEQNANEADQTTEQTLGQTSEKEPMMSAMADTEQPSELVNAGNQTFKEASAEGPGLGTSPTPDKSQDEQEDSSRYETPRQGIS